MIVPLSELSAFIAGKGPLFGLDLGKKRIGVAISDRGQIIATPYLLIERVKFTVDAALLLKHAHEKEVSAFVIGLPKHPNGDEGRACQSVRSFASHFQKLTELPLAFWDERYSTLLAEEALIKANLTRSRRKTLIDKAAATYILQGALDYLRFNGEKLLT